MVAACTVPRVSPVRVMVMAVLVPVAAPPVVRTMVVLDESAAGVEVAVKPVLLLAMDETVPLK